jgi:riboflavin synthase alpha subunit
MRFRDLIVEDYADDLQSEIINLLTAVSVHGVIEVDTTSLLTDLKMAGYSVDISTLLQVLDQIKIVKTATADTINISTDDTNKMVGANAKTMQKDRVANLAKKKSKQDIGDKL